MHLRTRRRAGNARDGDADLGAPLMTTRMDVARPSMGALEWGMLLLLAVLWGGSFFFSKIAVSELPPLTVVLCRVVIAALTLNAVVILSGRRMPANPALWRSLLVMGILNNAVPFSLIFWGQTQIASGLAAILNATTPLFTVLVAHVATPDEKLTVSRLLGVLIGVAGVSIMIGPGALTGGGPLLAKLAVLGAALSYGFAAIWGRRFRGLPPTVTAAGQLTASALVMTPVALLADRPWLLSLPSSRALGAIIALALLSTAAGYLLYFAVLARAGATNVSLVTLLIPPSALLLGALFLAEHVQPRDLLGLVCIAAGLAAIDGRVVEWSRKSGVGSRE
jgi:drug/metabolite transporter (DMT)-like permease